VPDVPKRFASNRNDGRSIDLQRFGKADVKGNFGRVASEDVRPRATESLVSGIFLNFFRNFAPPFPEKEMRHGQNK
jgi:hypothetical protein